MPAFPALRRLGGEHGVGALLMPAFPALLFVLQHGYIKWCRGDLSHIAPTFSSRRCPRCSIHHFTALQSTTPELSPTLRQRYSMCYTSGQQSTMPSLPSRLRRPYRMCVTGALL